ncbi:hypothetical protein DPMN_172628 [Dreissena polymorpha]|uniref:Uncharacterized protein n=1 Tax=Dreissena polymorpha TaxID=45954 RepID=A0A9D4E3A0_DREPO|nr:hypothetical protein DPMN_172628 [Dreissena polymorpha]
MQVLLDKPEVQRRYTANGSNSGTRKTQRVGRVPQNHGQLWKSKLRTYRPYDINVQE